MNEPRRLFEGGSANARRLLVAGRNEAPPASLVPAVLGALGVTAAGAAFAPGAKVGALLGRLLSLKVVGAGVVVVAVSGGYVAGRIHERQVADRAASSAFEPRAIPHVSAPPPRDRPAPPDRPIPVAAPAPAVVSARPLMPSLMEAPSPSAPPAGATPATPMRRPARAEGPTSSAAPPGVSSSVRAPLAAPPRADAPLAEEIEAIRKARAAVGAGDGPGALAGLDAYARAHPAGAFQEEALALRVRALSLAGDRDAAARALAELRTRFPNSVHLPALAGSSTREADPYPR